MTALTFAYQGIDTTATFDGQSWHHGLPAVVDLLSRFESPKDAAARLHGTLSESDEPEPTPEPNHDDEATTDAF